MDVPLPKLADTLTEGTLARWLKSPGDAVREGEAIAELETDKISSELPAPTTGVLREVLVGEGETVQVGTVLARITAAGERAQEPSGAATSASSQSVEAPRPDEERTPVSAATARAGAPTPGDTRALRLREHLRASRERVPEGMCAREIPGPTALDRLGEAATAAGRRRTPELQVTALPTARSHLVMPALPAGHDALVQAGAERDGRRLLTLCYDRRVLDDWQADRLLLDIARSL